MQDVYLGFGSNLGDREAMLRAALDEVDRLPQTQTVMASPIYETPPMGPQDQRAYLNQAVKITTALSAIALIQALQQIEQQLGRADVNQRQHWGPREIDIDLLLFGDDVIDLPNLSVPHPGMHQRWFVLKPLSDIAADLRHPVLGTCISKLLAGVDMPHSQKALP